MRTRAIFISLALVSCARLPPKPPDQATRNRLQIQGYNSPPSQTLVYYTQALSAEKYRVDNSHLAKGQLIGRMQGGQIKRDVFVSVAPSASGSQARVSIQQTQPFDLTTEGGREFFYPPLYARIYRRTRTPGALLPGSPQTATGRAGAPAAPLAPALIPAPASAPAAFYRKPAATARVPATRALPAKRK